MTEGTEGLIDELMALKNNEKFRNLLSTIIINKEIPESYPEELYVDRFRYMMNKSISEEYDGWNKGYERFKFREIYNDYCSWCLVSKDWIRELAKLLKGKNCIEIMAGKGLISYALQEEGVDIRATDDFSWGAKVKYTNIEPMDAVESIRETKDLDYVICSWPPYEDFTICEVAKVMAQKHPKAKLIYIGEVDGCNAPYLFWNLVDICKDKDSAIIDDVNKYFRSFEGIHDYVYIVKPNAKAKTYSKNKKRRRKEYGDMADEELYSS